METHRSANEVISFSRWGDTHPSSKIAVCCSELARQNKLIGDINEERREVEKWRGGGGEFINRRGNLIKRVARRGLI